MPTRCTLAWPCLPVLEVDISTILQGRDWKIQQKKNFKIHTHTRHITSNITYKFSPEVPNVKGTDLRKNCDGRHHVSQKTSFCGFSSDAAEDSVLLVHDTASQSNMLTFQSNILASYVTVSSSTREPSSTKR